MPVGVYKRTEQHKINISKAEKGKHNSPEIEFKRGHATSSEIRDKMRRPMTGRKASDITRRKMVRSSPRYWLGKKRSKETTDKVSRSLKGKLAGSKHPNWMGGISFEPYGLEFNKQLRELIRNRDNYKCQLCDCPEVENIIKLCVHHIDYNKKNSLPSNLISLCVSCNSKVNFNRKYWKQYFMEE